MSSVFAHILKINGTVVTRARLRDLADRLARTPDKALTNKVRKAIKAMDQNGVRSARIQFDPKLIDKTFMPDSVTLDELEGLYGIEVHPADLGEAKSGSTFFAEVSRRILDKIKSGTIPWRMPWSETFDAPAEGSLDFINYVTGKRYRGANWQLCMMFGGGSTSFITEKQAKERGGTIVNRKAGLPICYFVRSKVTKTRKVKDSEGNESTVTFEQVMAGMKWYTVYPMHATDGVKPVNRTGKSSEAKSKGLEFQPIEAAERIVKSYPAAPPISHGGSGAFYQPATDRIQMPPKASFRGIPQYYCVLFHELIHSTGHPKRLDRLRPGGRKTKTYAAEELVAELGASFLCAICRIDYFTLDNSAAYLKGWASRLETEIKNDKQFFMRQQFASMRAVRYMMGPLWKNWNQNGVLMPGKKVTISEEPKSKPTAKPRKPKATPKPAAKPTAAPAPTKGLPVGFKGSFFGWNFTIQVQMQIDNRVALEIWENGGGVVARIHGRNPVERETAQHNIWQRISKNIKEVHHFTELTKKDALKRIKNFVEALYKDAQTENRRRAKLGSTKSGAPKSSKAVHARYAAIIGKSQPASRVKKKGALSGDNDPEKVVLKVKALSTKLAKKLKLGNGNVVLKEGNLSFGLEHIVKEHSDEFKSKEEALCFIRNVLSNFNEIRTGKKGRPIFIINDSGAIAVTELEVESNQLRVVTAYTITENKIRNMPLVYSRADLTGTHPTPYRLPGYLHTHTVKRGDVAASGTGKPGGNERSKQQNPGQKSNRMQIVSAEDLAGIQYETLKLQGVWKDWLGEPAVNFDLLLSGAPGGGKSTLLLQFAHYLANNLKKRVLFVSKEEFGSATLAEKVQRLKIKGVHFTNTLNPDAKLQGDYDVVFVDSITDLRMSVDDYKFLRELNPDVAFLLIAQQTKGGVFKGSNEWPHETEIVAEVADGKAWCTKNRYTINKEPIQIPGYVQ